MGRASTPASPQRRRGASPPFRPDVDADPDTDGVALAAATTAGVLLGTRVPLAAAWVAATLCLVAASLGAGLDGRVRPGDDRSGDSDDRPGTTGRAHGSGRGPTGDGIRPRNRVLAGVFVLGALLAAGAAAASVRATAIQHGVLAGWAGRPGRVEVDGAVAEEPRRVRYGGYWVVLTVDRVRFGGRTHSTRERASLFLARGQWEALGRDPSAEGEAFGPGSGAQGETFGPGSGGQGEALGRSLGEGGRLAVGERLRVRASVTAARWSDPLGRQPPVVLRRPVVEGRAPPRGAVAGAVLRASEGVRDAARRRALATLVPERAGLLVGMALGDTSLLPGDLERDFRAAGLTHLMAVSGANLAVVLGAGLWLAGGAGAGRRALAAVGVVLVLLLVVVTRWEPSVLRAGVMAGLVLSGVATGRGPGGRRALCLAVVVLLLADPALVGALGFQLSVAATAGVLWLGPATARALPDRIPERVRTAVGMTLGAQATALPALALVFGRLSLAGLPANLLGLPLAGAPMLLGVVAAATAPLAPRVAALACRLADPFLVALIAVARWAAGLPGGAVTLTGPARTGPAVAVVLVLLVVARHRRSPYLAGPIDPPPDPERTVEDEMTTADELRRAALSLPEAEERETWGHPTFRVRDKMFATLSDDGRSAGVKTTKEEQIALVAAAPETFGVPAYVGRHGWVSIELAGADPAELRELVTEAWRQTAPKRLVAVYDTEHPAVADPEAGSPSMITLADIRRFAMALPEVVEKPHFRLPGFRVADKLLAHLEKDDEHAIVCVAQAEAETATADQPDVYEEVWRNGRIFVGLRVDLAKVTRKRMQELIEHAWRHRAPKHLVAEYDSR